MAGSVKLKVQEAVQDDINKGIVKIDSSFLHSIGVKPGDVVEVKGNRLTIAIADRAYPGDIGLAIIRMDGITRRNTKSSIGELVEIRKANVKEAKKVVIAPAQKGVIVKASPQLFKHGLLGRPVSKGDIVSLGGPSRRRTMNSQSALFDEIANELGRSGLGGFGFSDIKFIIAETSPKNAVIISDLTEIVFNPQAVEIKEDKIIDVSYEDIGGLSDEIKKVREMVELPLKHPEIFESLGIEPPKGVLLHGPPGTGKTLLARAVATETASHFILINGPEIMGKFHGESEANIRKKFEEAEKNAPAIIFLDEIDAIAPKREESYGEVEKRVVAQLLGMMDGLKSRGKVVVIAATNIPDAIDPALRRPGRFDREIEIGVPNSEARLGILKIHTRNMPIDINPKALDKNLDVEGIRKSLINVLTHVKTDHIVSIAKPILAKVSSANREDSYERLKKQVNTYLNKIYTNIQTVKSRGYFIEECLSTITNEIRDSFARVESESELEDRITEFIEKIKADIDHLISVTVKAKMLADLAYVTVGFVGADLNALSKEAAMVVLRRILPDLKLKEDEPLPKEILEKLRISMDDFKEALKVVRPSAMREVLVDIPNIKWGDVGGLQDVKQELREAIEWPLKYKSSFDRLGVKPPQGVLMYGPPGTGKTLLAKAAANEANANFIPVKGPELLSKWVGESEKAIRKIFKKARQMSPSIIFFDEIDSLVPNRSSGDNGSTERVVNQLLTEMDGLENLEDVVVMAATNRPDMIDTALLRPGRFDRIILCPVPDEEAREKIFRIHTKNMQIDFASVNSKFLSEKEELNIKIKNITNSINKSKSENKTIESIRKLEEERRDLDSNVTEVLNNSKKDFYKKLSKATDGYVGADIESVAREAAMLALRKDLDTKEIKFEFFEKALEKVYPSSSKEIQKSYEALKHQFSKARAKQMEEEKPNYYG